MKKNVLITGGAGFIGSNLAFRLLQFGHTVRVIDNLSIQVHGHNPEVTSPLYRSIMNKVEFIRGDITSRTDLIKAISAQNAIIHLAAETGTGQSMYEIKKYSDVNIGGTALLLDILTNENHNVQKLIIASSRAVYGEGRYSCLEHGIVFPESRKDGEMAKGDFECKCPICDKAIKLLSTTEDSKINPTSIYGITKQTQEQMALTAGSAIGLPTVVFRYQNVYGPGQSLSNPYTGILSIFSSRIKNGKNIDVFEDGLESRDFVYIDDVVDATILGLEKSEANYEVFNVGSNEPINVKCIAETLKNIFKHNIQINITGNYRTGDIRHNYADLTKIIEKLKYRPKIQFEEGVSRFCSWVGTQEIMPDRYHQSINELTNKGLFK
jgi:dTDP-L-rhamnose 4-epimerase